MKVYTDIVDYFVRITAHADQREYQRNIDELVIASMIADAADELSYYHIGERVNIIDGQCTLTVAINSYTELAVVTVINERYINKKYNNIIIH